MKTGRYAAGIFVALAIAATSGCGGGGIDGMYIMTRMGFGGSLNIEAYRFDDGNVVRNPVVPGNSLDVDAETKVHPQDVGTYEVDGGEMTMSFGTSQSKAKLERDGGCFNWDMGIFCPVEAFAGETLEGKFGGGASARGSNGIVMNSRTIVFAGDGTYTMESAASFSTSSSGSTASGGSTGGEKGEYEIKGQVITFRPAGGEARTLTAFPFDDGTDGPKPRRIYLGGTMLKHE